MREFGISAVAASKSMLTGNVLLFPGGVLTKRNHISIATTKVYVRACYGNIYDKRRTCGNKVFVTGTNGIGKSIFRTYVFCRMMEEAARASKDTAFFFQYRCNCRIVTFQQNLKEIRGFACEFSHVRSLASSWHSQGVNIESLATISQSLWEIHDSLRKSVGWMFSNLEKDHVNQHYREKYAHMIKEFMPIWSLHELQDARDKLGLELALTAEEQVLVAEQGLYVSPPDDVIAIRYNVYGGIAKAVLVEPLRALRKIWAAVDQAIAPRLRWDDGFRRKELVHFGSYDSDLKGPLSGFIAALVADRCMSMCDVGFREGLLKSSFTWYSSDELISAKLFLLSSYIAVASGSQKGTVSIRELPKEKSRPGSRLRTANIRRAIESFPAGYRSELVSLQLLGDRLTHLLDKGVQADECVLLRPIEVDANAVDAILVSDKGVFFLQAHLRRLNTPTVVSLLHSLVEVCTAKSALCGLVILVFASTYSSSNAVCLPADLPPLLPHYLMCLESDGVATAKQ